MGRTDRGVVPVGGVELDGDRVLGGVGQLHRVADHLAGRAVIAATAANDYGLNWIPRISGDHSHMAYFTEMMNGNVDGLFVMGDNPAVAGPKY